MTIPQITAEHWNKGLDFSRNNAHFSMLDAINKAVEIALAEANAPTCQVRNDDTGELKTMTREAAKKLRSETVHSCDWFDINGAGVGHNPLNFLDDGVYTYRAVKQDPHAALRAEYAKQVAEGTTGFYLWEKCTDCDWYHGSIHFNFSCNEQYRCTDISCYVSKDGEPAIRMLIEEAVKYLKDMGDSKLTITRG